MKVKMYQYTSNSILTLRQESDVPVFGEVSEIFVYNACRVIFIVHEMTTQCFNEHYHVYQVKKESRPVILCVRYSDICDQISLTLLQSCGQKLLGSHFIVPRYNIFP